MAKFYFVLVAVISVVVLADAYYYNGGNRAGSGTGTSGGGYGGSGTGTGSNGGSTGNSGGYGTGVGGGTTNNGTTGGGYGSSGSTGTGSSTNGIRSGAPCRSLGSMGRSATGQQCVCNRPNRMKRQYGGSSGSGSNTLTWVCPGSGSTGNVTSLGGNGNGAPIGNDGFSNGNRASGSGNQGHLHLGPLMESNETDETSGENGDKSSPSAATP